MENTGMPDEKYFTTYLLPFDEAVARLHSVEAHVVAYVHALWKHTQRIGRNESSSLTQLLPEPPPREVQTPTDPWEFSPFSSSAIEDGFWCPSDFLLCAGMVLIQPSTRMVLLMHDEQTKMWFLPRGCKNVNETLEEAALREGAELVRVFRVTTRITILTQTNSPVITSNFCLSTRELVSHTLRVFAQQAIFSEIQSQSC
jgi:hypothetical protein